MEQLANMKIIKLVESNRTTKELFEPCISLSYCWVTLRQSGPQRGNFESMQTTVLFQTYHIRITMPLRLSNGVTLSASR
jgi:hypothetical protein